MSNLKAGVLIILTAIPTLSGCRHFPAWLLKAPPGSRGVFPAVSLEAPDRPEIREHLGLRPDAKTFTLADIRADLVIVEAMDMYCRFCQKSAPAANELRQLLETRNSGKRIRMIGISLGNSKFEADLFARKYHVAFPLFSDPDSTVHDALGRIGTPTFYALELKNGAMIIVGVHRGALSAGESRRFLDRVLRH